MNTERQRILELVAEGTITAAQAEELLAALDDETRSTSTTVIGAKEQSVPPTRQAKSESARYVQALKELGVPVPSVDELIALRSEGLTPEYVRSIREADITNFTVNDLISVDDLISMYSNGITPEYVRRMREAGVVDFSLDDLISMFSEGVTPEYVAEMRAAGLKDLSPNNLIAMASSGLDADTLRAL